MPPIRIAVQAPEAAALLADADWWTLARLRSRLCPAGKTVLAHDGAADRPYAFLACDVTPADGALKLLRRFFVVLPREAIVCFDIAVVADKAQHVEWSLEHQPPGFVYRPVLPRPGGDGSDERMFLNVLSTRPLEARWLHSLDLEGVRIGQRVILFHADASMARTAVYFNVEARGTLSILLAGLAPGLWDVWWNGYLEKIDERVRQAAGTLLFEGESGGYYLRRRD